MIQKKKKKKKHNNDHALCHVSQDQQLLWL